MKTPIWEESTGSLQAWLLANRLAVPVDLWTITLRSGAVLRYSSADVAVTFGGNTYALGPIIEAGDVRQKMGVGVDTMSMSIAPRDSDAVGSVPMMQALAAGLFDGAEVARWRMFLDSSRNLKGVIPEFLGRVGDVKITRTKADIQVRSWLELLNVNVPGHVYQPGCRRVLFDAKCGVSRAAFTVAGVLGSADSTRRVHTTTSAAVVGKPAEWAALGEMAFTSGANAGVARSVSLHGLSGGTATITTIRPFPFQAQAGDTFTITAGCDKKRTTCRDKFSNGARFAGEPFVPPPETTT
jgi:uncharacterized phage protein (TIGR02218 family)